jgi:hypothetical protein
MKQIKTKNELYKHWYQIWIKLDDCPFDLEQFLILWEGLAISYEIFLDVTGNEDFAEDINGTDTFKSEDKFIEVCEKYFG